MEAILIEDVENLGRRGDIVKIKGGYFRNFLFPGKKAVPCTPDMMRWQVEEKARRAERDAQEKALAETLAKRLSKVQVEIKAEVSESDKLYGSVTALDIVNALEKQGHKIDEKQVALENPIKTAGDYTVKVRLHAEVQTEVRVAVKGKAAPKSEGEK